MHESGAGLEIRPRLSRSSNVQSQPKHPRHEAWRGSTTVHDAMGEWFRAHGARLGPCSVLLPRPKEMAVCPMTDQAVYAILQARAAKSLHVSLKPRGLGPEPNPASLGGRGRLSTF